MKAEKIERYTVREQAARWLVKFLIFILTFGSAWPAFFDVPRAYAAETIIFITSTASTTWTVPDNWNSASNTIEVIGGGGSGYSSASAGAGAGGGGGGAYAKISNFASSSAGTSVNIQVGVGGAPAASGTVTYFGWTGSGSTSTCSASTMSICAMQGNRATTSTGAAVVATSTSVGATKNAGGAGGTGGNVSLRSGGGGGGAGAPGGDGRNGGAGDTATANDDGGGGGGGAGGASATAGTAGGITGGAGGQGPAGTGSGAGGNGATPVAPVAGTNGGGGGGADQSPGGSFNSGGAAGGAGTEWDATHGAGGGGGAAASGTTPLAGGNGGLYGAGGGGGEGASNGGSGAQGIIVIRYTPLKITLADGTTQPAPVTVGPGDNATTSAVFTFVTDAGTSTISNVTTTVATTTGVYQIQITDNAGTTVYGSSTNPSSVTSYISLSGMNVSSSATTFRILIKSLNATSMPAVPGATSTVTSTLTDWLDSKVFQETGSNTTSSVITIDNLSPADVTSASGTVGNAKVDFSWVNPGDSDYHSTVILRATSSVTQVPAEGTTYSVNDTIGTSTVACVVASPTATCTSSGLTNGTAYHYKAFSRDNYANYAAGVVPTGSPFTPTSADPKMSAAASEIFTASTTNAISAITVTSTAASQITAANDIRITLATSSGAPVLFWDTSDVTATLSGSGDASPTVSYESGSSTLVVNVLTDFANASSVTISGLSYVVSSTLNAATTTRDLKWQGAGQAPPFVRDTSSTVTIRGRLDLGQHSAGQQSDKFATSSSAVNQELYNFQLNPQDESASTTLTVDLSSVTGIATADVSGAQIFVDTNANGAIGGGETSTPFGPGTVSISGGSGTISFLTIGNIPSATSTRYILKATTTALLAGDTMTINLATSSVNSSGTTSKAQLVLTSATPPNSVTHTVDAVSRTQRSFRFQNDDGTTVNNNSNLAAAADIAVSNIKIGQRLALRLQLDNDGGGDAGLRYRLQFQANATSGSWTNVGATSTISYSQGLSGTNNDSITSAVGASNSRTFRNGVWQSNTNISSSTDLLNAQYTEVAYMIQTASVASGTTYYFRVVNDSGATPLDSYPIYPSLATVQTGNDLYQYSKQIGSFPNNTSSLTYFFDDNDYTNASSSNNAYVTSTASGTVPVMNFRARNSTSSFPLKLTWEGRYSAASTTFFDVYHLGAVNAWETLNSTSGPSVNTDFLLTGNVTSSIAEYYEFDGTNYWAYVRARQATTTGSLNTDQIKVEFAPIHQSAADQLFDVNGAQVSSSQITITTSRTPVVTAANDIDIKIPSAMSMAWATSTTVVSLGGNASTSASTTVSYPDNKTLRINVTTDFVANDTLIVSGLAFRNFGAGAGSSTLEAYYDGSSDTAPEAFDLRVMRIRGLMSVADNNGGQVGNKYDAGTGTVSNAELLSCKFTPTGENATTTQVVISLSDISGFVSSSVTGAQLFVDTNGDGTISGAETQTVGGVGSVSDFTGGNGTITFSSSFNVAGATNLILKATTTSVDPGDRIRFQTFGSNMLSTGQTSKASLSPTGSSSKVTHARPSGAGGGGAGNVGGAPSGASSVVGGLPGGGSSGSGTPPPSNPPNQGGGVPSGGGGSVP